MAQGLQVLLAPPVSQAMPGHQVNKALSEPGVQWALAAPQDNQVFKVHRGLMANRELTARLVTQGQQGHPETGATRGSRACLDQQDQWVKWVS